jgi:hypothetical protein
MFGTLKRIAKKILANRVFKAVYDAVNIVVLEVFGWSRVLTHLYYTVLPLAFNREQAAVFRGRRNYYRDKFRPSVTHVGLRRNVHRIEKALIADEADDGVAVEYNARPRRERVRERVGERVRNGGEEVLLPRSEGQGVRRHDRSGTQFFEVEVAHESTLSGATATQ